MSKKRIEYRKPVADLIAILGRDIARVDTIEEVIRDLEMKRRQAEIHSLFYPFPLNKRDKKIAQSLGWAAMRLEKRLQHGDAKIVVGRATHGQQAEFIQWQKELTYWRERFASFAGTGHDNRRRGTFFEGLSTKQALGRPKPSSEKFALKHRVVEAAAKLLKSHGLPLTVTRRTATREASIFCRVAAVLYGDKRADLTHQCRVFKKRETGAPNSPG